MAEPGLRIKGQEIRIIVVEAGNPVLELNSISNFNDEAKFDLKEDGFLGEAVNRFDEVHNGYGFDFEMQVTGPKWLLWQRSITNRAQRITPGVIFNIVRVDQFANGETAVITYEDVKWGSMPTSIGSRGDYVKVKASGACSTRTEQINSIL